MLLSSLQKNKNTVPGSFKTKSVLLLESEDKSSLTPVHLCIETTFVIGSSSDGSWPRNSSHDLCTMQLPSAKSNLCAVSGSGDTDSNEEWR
jgi:hypothetical protein